jgi:ribonuclease R
MPTPLSPVVQSFLAIKEYATATYSATETGHFGLSLPSYTHFTSPIRRYFDVILHRLLAGHVYEPAMLSTLLDHINSQERTVEGLQKLYTKWVLCDWLSPGTAFTATITGVKKAGVYVLIEEIMLDGFIHVSQLGGKRWTLENDILVSEGTSLRLGDSLRVQVLSINKILQTIEFAAVF